VLLITTLWSATWRREKITFCVIVERSRMSRRKSINMVLREREILFNILKQYGTLVLHIIRQDGKEIFHLADFYPGNKNDVKFFKKC
jgi:hypothetical protein